MNKIVINEAIEKETGTLTKVDNNDWITFLPMCDRGGAYDSYSCGLKAGQDEDSGSHGGKGDTQKYVNKCSRRSKMSLPGREAWEELKHSRRCV